MNKRKMENGTKIKLKSAKHKIGVGYREREKKSTIYPYLQNHEEMLNDKLRNYKFLVFQN